MGNIYDSIIEGLNDVIDDSKGIVFLKKETMVEYRGYNTVAEYSAEDMVWHGKIDGIKDLVDFFSDSQNEIEKNFKEAVDDYLIFCEEVGKAPDKAAEL